MKFLKKENGNYLYKCKCQYFWENILKFENNIDDDIKKTFPLCNWKCSNKSHTKTEYCQLDLWHEEKGIIPKNFKWIRKGHAFNCDHLGAVYSIFLIDQSESMKSQSIKPQTNIKYSMNNMLGCAIEAILDYCKIRFDTNPRD